MFLWLCTWPQQFHEQHLKKPRQKPTAEARGEERVLTELCGWQSCPRCRCAGGHKRACLQTPWSVEKPWRGVWAPRQPCGMCRWLGAQVYGPNPAKSRGLRPRPTWGSQAKLALQPPQPSGKRIHVFSFWGTHNAGLRKRFSSQDYAFVYIFASSFKVLFLHWTL